MGDRDKEWEFHLRSLSSTARDSNYATDPTSDPSLLNSVKRLYELCKSEKSEELAARVYPHLNKIFQRCVSSISQTQTSKGLLLLPILQFFLEFGDAVLHDAEPSLRTFFKLCLSREFADPAVAEATLEFLNSNKIKLLNTSPTLLPQELHLVNLATMICWSRRDFLHVVLGNMRTDFFPLLLKLIAWNGEKLENFFLRVFSGFVSLGSFIPLFPHLLDLPILVVALEKVEKSSGPLVGSSIASIQKSAAPEMLLALMDEAYTGSTIGDGSADSESEDSTPMAATDPLFLDLLKDENDGLAERHWTSPEMATALQAVINAPLSNRLKESLKIAPRLLDSYFTSAVLDSNDSLICALIPLIMARYSTLFPDRIFCYEVQKRLLEFMLAAFHRSPQFIALLKTELALQLCWAIGEYGDGGGSHKDAARELFESLELLLYENLSSSRLGLGVAVHGSGSSIFRKSSQSRLLCFVVTAIAKLATYHRELLPRARVSLAKVARSRISDARVWKRAQDFLGLMNEPAVCMSVLGTSSPASEFMQYPGTINWKEGHNKMVSHVPFYLLGGQEAPPYHDFSFRDILPAD